MATDRLTLDVEEKVEQIATLDDASLVWAMHGLLGPIENEGVRWPSWGGGSVNGAALTRIVFMEIAMRWVPLEVAAEALARHFDGLDDDDQDAIDAARAYLERAKVCGNELWDAFVAGHPELTEDGDDAR